MLHNTLRDKLKGDILLTGGDGPEAAAINRLLAPALKDGSLKKLCPTVYTTAAHRIHPLSDACRAPRDIR